MEIQNEIELEARTQELFWLTKLIYTTQEEDERSDELTRAIEAYETEHYPMPDMTLEQAYVVLRQDNSGPNTTLEDKAAEPASEFDKRFKW